MRFVAFRKRLYISYLKGAYIMNNILRPTLELTVIIPGMILAYLPVKSTLKISLQKLIAWLFPLLIALCILGGILCSALQIKTAPILFFLLLFLLVIYHKTLAISIWKSFSRLVSCHSYCPNHDR